MDVIDSGPNRDHLQSQLACLDAEYKQGGSSRIEQGHSSSDIPDAGPDRSRYDLKYVQAYEIKWYDNLYILYCVAVYLADVITDIMVCEQYFSNRDYIWFALTLFFIIFAHFIMAVFSMKWYCEDLAKEESKTRIVILHILSLGPVLRYWKVYKTGKKTRNQDESRIKYNSILFEQWRDLTMLRLFEAFIESGPQMVLQLYILAYSRSFNEQEDWKTAFSACCSLLSLSSSIVSYSKALRDARVDRGKMSYWAFACQLVWRLTMVASRIITLVLFASVYKTWLLLVLIPHWLISVLWVYCQRSSFFNNSNNEVKPSKLWKCLFSIIVGFIYVFCFFNTKDGPTRKRLVKFYVLMFVEMVVLIGLWLPYRHEYGVVFVAAIAWVAGGFVIGVIAMILYYQCYHPSLPTQGLCFRTRHDVPASRNATWYYLCCGCCCRLRQLEGEEVPSEYSPPRNIMVDIPAGSGSVGRSFERESSPPFESEWLTRAPSEAQRKHSLEKHKRKKLQEERIQRMRDEAKNKQVVSLDDINTIEPSNNHANGTNTYVGYRRTAVKDDGQEGDDVTTTVVYDGTCDDGVHCGTDDEQETKVESKTCDDGVHCGTDDEQETSTERGICAKSAVCAHDDDATCSSHNSTSKELCPECIIQKSTTPNSLLSPMLTFDNRYSIVSDCISLSSSSSDNEIQDEDLGKHPINTNSPKRRSNPNKIHFPNFVASTLNTGRFSSLRLSRENVITEERTALGVQRRHSVDYSELNLTENQTNDYVTFLKKLKPKRFGSVRDCTLSGNVNTI